MIQTESPYYQPMPCPPEPFEGALGKFSGDPKYHCKEVAAADQDFSGCDESWGIIMRKSANVFIAAAGIYSWFSTYSQDCSRCYPKCEKFEPIKGPNHRPPWPRVPAH